MIPSPQKQAETGAYTCRLIYLILVCFDLYYIYLYQTPITDNYVILIAYFAFLGLNLYLFLTTGNNPGFAQPDTEEQDQWLSMALNNQVCELCMCRKLLRMKHCYECGKCVYKFDHHCTWIGSCVGEYNHGKFWTFCLLQTIQAIWTLIIYCETISRYSYKEGEEYNGAYGAIMVMIILMTLYVMFVGGMLAFHSYLIVFNTTTYETTKFTKLPYMKGRMYPFSDGLCNNVRSVFCHGKSQPVDWVVKQEDNKGQPNAGGFNWWNNKYYSCC